ncbi:MAG: hypothetical protein ACM3KR_03270 [Deltaproteobacteria bacterium]
MRRAKKSLGVEKILHDAGMSSSAEYYSGRGATLSDLNGNTLIKIYSQIKEAFGSTAGNHFLELIRDINVLSATDFIVALKKLERNDWVWAEHMSENEQGRGIAFNNEASAFATVIEVLSRCSYQVDDTDIIKSDFVRLFHSTFGKNEITEEIQRKMWGDRASHLGW